MQRFSEITFQYFSNNQLLFHKTVDKIKIAHSPKHIEANENQ